MVSSHPIAVFLMANFYPIAHSYGKVSPHPSFSLPTLRPSLFLMVNSHPIALLFMVNSHPFALFLMVSSHPISVFLMVTSHPIALFLMVNSHPIALFLMVNSHPIGLPYGELSPHHSF